MNIKPWKTALCLLLCSGLWLGGASAGGNYRRHQRETPKLEEGSKVSSWAWEEVERAMELEICPSDIEYMDFSTPATRNICLYYASRLIASQQNCDQDELDQVILHCYGETGEEEQKTSVFSDLRYPGLADAMYYLGVAKGRDDGTFDPDGTLTRQEAAVFLARTYQAYGGELPAPSGVFSFTDWNQVADWAKESVAAMAGAGIMQGYEDGRFAPGDPYTYEQCVISLLRLYENMPVSRKNGNVKTLFTYEQYLSVIENEDNWLRMKWKVEGPLATFVKQIDPLPNSIPTVPTYYKLIYRSGAVRELKDLGICDNGWGELGYYIELEDPHFSEDGKTLFYTVTLPYDVGEESTVDDPFYDPFSTHHTHQAGSYTVELDVESRQVRAVTKLDE